MKLKALPTWAEHGTLALAGVALVVAGACTTPRPGAQPVTRSTRLVRPPYMLVADSVTRRGPSFMAYINRTTFRDDERDADRRVLMRRSAQPGDTSEYVGPKAELLPVEGAEDLPDNWHSFGQVIAKIILHGNADYPALRLHPGPNFVCVPASASTDSTFQALVISPGHGGGQARVDTLSMVMRSMTGPARFLLSPRDDGYCTPCDNKYCCTQ